MSESPFGPCGCSPLGPGPTPTPTIVSGASMPLGWPVGRPLSPMCCYAQPNRVPQYLYLFGATTATNVTTGYFAKHSSSTDPLAVAPLVRSNGFGGVNPNDPWLMMGNWTLVDIKVVCAGASVNQATVGADPRLRLDLFQVNETNTTNLMTLNLPCISGVGSIGVNNDSSGRTGLIYFSQHSFSPPFKPTPFTFLGWLFIAETANNNQISEISIASSALIFKGVF